MRKMRVQGTFNIESDDTTDELAMTEHSLTFKRITFLSQLFSVSQLDSFAPSQVAFGLVACTMIVHWLTEQLVADVSMKIEDHPRVQ